MDDHLPDNIKQAAEHVESAIDRKDDELEQTAEKLEPHVEEARARLAENERSSERRRH